MRSVCILILLAVVNAEDGAGKLNIFGGHRKTVSGIRSYMISGSSNITGLTCPKPETIKDGTPCIEVIRQVSVCDKCLDSRADLKKEIAKKTSNAEDFEKEMKGRKCNGTEYNCGHTRSYVTEIFEGLRQHYEESKFDSDQEDDARKAHSYRYTGASLRKLLESQASNPNTIIYHMRHTGTHDHVFAVEQVAQNQGYRVYQSYHDGYSLRAWISEDLAGLYDPDHGDIMLPRAAQAHNDMFMKMMTNGTASLNNTEPLKDIPELAGFKPYVDFIAKFDQKQALDYFEKSWKMFGKGRILTKEEFMGNSNESFVGKLATLIDYFEPRELSNKEPYPQDIWDKWTELHASPDPMYFPGLPYGALSSILVKGKKYRFDVKGVVIKGEPRCAKNARVILGE